jgi:hypothetical protein
MADTTTPSRTWQKAGLHLLFFFRFIQLGSVTIAGFIYCYLAWHHNNHYCAYYPRYCTAEQRTQVKVLWEYKVAIAAVRPICYLLQGFQVTFCASALLLSWKVIFPIYISFIGNQCQTTEFYSAPCSL